MHKFHRLASWFLHLSIAVVLQGSGIRGQGSVSHSPIPFSPQVGEVYGRLPLSFEENRGQVDGIVKFLSRGNGDTLFLTPTEAVLALKAQSPKTKDVRTAIPRLARNTVLRMKLVGANPAAQIDGIQELTGKSNYFIGNDPAKWRTNVANYASVKY